MFDRLKALLQHRREIASVEAMDARALADLGMSRAQLRDFLDMPRDIEPRVLAMGAVHGLSPATVQHDHGLWLEMLATCGHCADRGACALNLTQGALRRPDDAAFCPNHAALAALATEARARAA